MPMHDVCECAILKLCVYMYVYMNYIIIDASVMPFIPNGNVHSTVTVVASMAAEFLLEQYQFILTLL